jgi:hypothetical protein
MDLNARTVRLDPGTTKSGQGRVILIEGEILQVKQEQWERRKLQRFRVSPLLCFAHMFSTAREIRSEYFATFGPRPAKKQTSPAGYSMTFADCRSKYGSRRWP